MNEYKTLHQFLIELHKNSCSFASKEQKEKLATNSELHRWIKQGAIQINGEICKDPKELIDFPIISFVLFPKSKLRSTLF